MRKWLIGRFNHHLWSKKRRTKPEMWASAALCCLRLVLTENIFQKVNDTDNVMMCETSEELISNF